MVDPRSEGKEPDEQSKRIIRKEMDFSPLRFVPRKRQWAGPGPAAIPCPFFFLQQLSFFLTLYIYMGMFGSATSMSERGSDAAFMIPEHAVHFATFRVARGCRTQRRPFGGIFPLKCVADAEPNTA
jgi:hypothetical protein